MFPIMAQPILTNCIIYSCFMQTKSVFCSDTSIEVRFFTALSAYRVTGFSVYLFLHCFDNLFLFWQLDIIFLMTNIACVFLPFSYHNQNAIFTSFCTLLNVLQLQNPHLLVTFAGVNSSVTVSSDKSSDKW